MHTTSEITGFSSDLLSAQTMTEKAEQQKDTGDAKPKPEISLTELMDKPIPTAWGYRGFVLLTITFLVFELVFLSLYSSTSWFGTEIRYFGIPVVLALLPVTHQILLSFEKKPLLQIASPLRNGLPLILYWHWLRLDDTNLTIGLRKVAYSTIDELKLTIWGNLHIRTRALRLGVEGSAETDQNRASSNEPTDLILKLPLGVVSPQFQKKFIETVKAVKPDVLINKRLRKRLNQQDVSASQMVGVMGAMFLLIVLLDLGQASYTYLDVLKNYYNADLSARKNERADSERYFEQGEKILKESLPLSWIKIKFFDEGNGAAGVRIARADALWHMGRHQEAIDECRHALKLSPKAFRINLKLARMLNAIGSPDLAKSEIEQAIENKSDSFLPRNYMIALRYERLGKQEAEKLFDEYLKELDEDLFGEEPPWPPGGERIIHDVWHRDDLVFVYDRLLQRRLDKNTSPAVAK